MPSIVYDNVRYIQSNKIQCKKCLAIIDRNAHEEFKWCSCRTLGVDNDRYFAIDKKQKVWLSQELMETFEKMAGSPPTPFI